MEDKGYNNDWKKRDTIMNGRNRTQLWLEEEDNIMNERNGTQLWLEEEGHNNEWKK